MNWLVPIGNVILGGEKRLALLPSMLVLSSSRAPVLIGRDVMDNYHITKTDDGWALKKEGADRASKTAETKAEITAVAREFLAGKDASLKIHKQDGKIQEERTYPRKADPKKTKG